MKSFKDYTQEEVAANAVSGMGVDLTPSSNQIFFKKRDKRRKEDNESMYRKSLGLKYITNIYKRRKSN